MMSDSSENKLFHTLDQLTQELFPEALEMGEEGFIRKTSSDEADVLARKLIDELLNKQGSEQE